VGLLAGGWFLYASARSKDAELATSQSELATVRAENEQLKQVPDQSAELARLRKDNEELLRLRSEVNRMRDQNKQLSNQLQVALNQRSQVQQQQQETSAEIQSLRSQTQQLQQAEAQAHASLCANNLRVIQAAKQQWALDNKKPEISIPTAADLAPYLPNRAMPVCPDGGTYTINPISVPPTCSIPNHTMPR
jgi:TolA-binding protein